MRFAIQKLKFYARSEIRASKEDYEKAKRHAFHTGKIVDRYSSVKNRDMIGKHLQVLVKLALKAEGFEIKAENSNRYNRKRYKRSDHDLDIIAVHRQNRDFAVGVEVKNTLDIIQPALLDTKIDICKDLGLVPVFAIRWNKPYIDCIRKQNGFSWVFKVQMYPLGQEDFVRAIYKRCSAKWKKEKNNFEYMHPISVRTELPEKSVRQFQKWVGKNLENPPRVNTDERCMPDSSNH